MFFWELVLLFYYRGLDFRNSGDFLVMKRTCRAEGRKSVSTFRTVYSARLQENPVLLSIKGTMWTVFTWHTTGGKVHVENITTDGAENENIWRTVIICFSVGPRYFKRFMYWQKHYAIRATNEKNFPYNIYIFFFCLYFFNTVLSPKKNNVR